MAHNMYRVGDFVYFEMSAGAPYQIRKIEELNKVNQSGAVEAKVTCYYRRRDIPSNLLQLADKHSGGSEAKEANGRVGQRELTEQQLHRVRHRELFVSRQVETLPATHIRGKCGVSLLNETESPVSYLHKDDAFFYSLKYDPAAKTLLADRGEIRVGMDYQAVIPELLSEGEKDTRQDQKLADLEWQADHGLPEEKVDEFWLLARSVGTMARAYDSTSAVRQPNLLMSAAAASRDATHLRALQVLHRSNYDFNKAVSALVPSRSPLLCRDEMEEWSASEGNLFEEAMDKYGKNFHDIRNDFLPWKTYPALVEYYYMWKTTDRYVQQKRIKAAEADTRLKQVYIPAYSRPSPAMTCDTSTPGASQACECCNAADTPLWYASDVGTRYRLCTDCWNYWKRYGGMKFSKEVHNSQNTGGPSDTGACDEDGPITMHTSGGSSTHRLSATIGGAVVGRVSQQRSFLFQSSMALRVARRLCRENVKQRELSRQPFLRSIEVESVGQQYDETLSARGADEAPPIAEMISRGRDRRRANRAGSGCGSGQLMYDTLLRLHGGRLPSGQAVVDKKLDATSSCAPVVVGSKRKGDFPSCDIDHKRRAKAARDATDRLSAVISENGDSHDPPELSVDLSTRQAVVTGQHASARVTTDADSEREERSVDTKPRETEAESSAVHNASSKSKSERMNGLVPASGETDPSLRTRRSCVRSGNKEGGPQKSTPSRRQHPDKSNYHGGADDKKNGTTGMLSSAGGSNSLSRDAPDNDNTLCEIYVVSDTVRRMRRSLPRGQLRKLSRRPFEAFDLSRDKS